ncbi:retrovirus-related pol polyprotein from transposon TNT 1-94 [Tanacetum coccineum]
MESKFHSLALDELIGNLKVHEVVMEKDSEIYRGKKERVKSIALKSNKESSDDETSTSRSDDEEYAMVIRNLKKFFKRNGKFVRQPREEKKSFRQRDERKGKSDRNCFRCGDPNHLIGDCPKPSRNKDQKAFIGGSWSDSENDVKDKTNDETCLVAQSSNEVCLRTCLEPDEWIKDSGCSKHMTGNKSLFSTYKAYDEGKVVFRSNLKGKITDKVKESLNVTFDESPPPIKLSPLVDDDFGEEEAIKKNTKVVNNNNNEEDESIEVDEIVNIKESKNHPLDQALYGLKQAPKAWYDRLKAFLLKHEYSMGMVDNTLFTKKSKSHLIIVQIYVDDIIFGSTSQSLCDDFAKIVHDEFEMSMMGELNFFLGLQIKQMGDGIFFNQSKYIKEMLKKFGLEDSKPTKTSMSTEIKLTKDDEVDSVDSSKYRGMISSLLYLTASRPDIMFSVCLCAHFQENPKTTHLEAVKHIFRYIRGTTHLGLWYSKGTRIETIVYADSDHTGDYVDRKSTSGVCTFMRCCLTSWFAKKQTALIISKTKAQYVSTGKACQQALWMKQAFIDYDIRLDDILIMCDNKGIIDLSKNPV